MVDTSVTSLLAIIERRLPSKPHLVCARSFNQSKGNLPRLRPFLGRRSATSLITELQILPFLRGGGVYPEVLNERIGQ